jgi:hypothetical protein
VLAPKQTGLAKIVQRPALALRLDAIFCYLDRRLSAPSAALCEAPLERARLFG